MLLQHLCERKPCPVVTFGDMAGGLELCGRAQKLFRFRLATLRQLQSQIQIRLEDIRFRCHRFSVRSDRAIDLPECVLHKTQIKPCNIIVGIAIHHLLQQRLGSDIVLFLDRLFRLAEF